MSMTALSSMKLTGFVLLGLLATLTSASAGRWTTVGINDHDYNRLGEKGTIVNAAGEVYKIAYKRYNGDCMLINTGMVYRTMAYIQTNFITEGKLRQRRRLERKPSEIPRRRF